MSWGRRPVRSLRFSSAQSAGPLASICAVAWAAVVLAAMMSQKLRSLIEQTAYHYQVPIGKVPSGPAGRFLTLPNDGRTGEFVYSDAVSTARESP